ncbi:hypothetical protein [Pyruvatibacter mobilis]|uniref:hypothetical protein n=1 Tax=Pyruvatibacter mobilis TaxID=1712261 RepID=UPI003BAAF4C6
MSDDDPTPPQSANSHSARSKSAPAQSAQRLGLEPMPLKQAGLGLALLLYAISLALPGLHLRDYPPVEGYRILLTGWYGLMVLQLAWLANPLFAAAAIAAFRHRPRLAFGLAAAAFGIGLLSFTATNWIAHHAYIERLGAGFYVWMAAFLVLAATSLISRRTTPSGKPPTPPA